MKERLQDRVESLLYGKLLEVRMREWDSGTLVGLHAATVMEEVLEYLRSRMASDTEAPIK